MSAPTNRFPSDVRTLSDDELKILSEELYEAYMIPGYEEEIWTDADAEDRYWEMRAEMRRRWELANPEEAERLRNTPFLRLALEALHNNIAFTERVKQNFAQQFGEKIGDTLSVRMPPRFTGKLAA